MSVLTELRSSDAVRALVDSRSNVLITFSAHWCGPCRQSKPALEALVRQWEQDATLDLAAAIVYEDNLGDTIHAVWAIRAFPTYVLFQQGKEVNRVEGANLNAVQTMIDRANCTKQTRMPTTGGTTLGGHSTADARLARVMRLANNNTTTASTTTTATSTTNEDTEMKDQNSTANSHNHNNKPSFASETKPTAVSSTTAAATNVEDTKPKAMDTSTDDNNNDKTNDESMDVDAPTAATVDPTEKLDKEALETLTGAMGFSLLRAQKGLLYGNGGTVEGAVEWLLQHQDDDDIDEPIQLTTADAASGQKAQSYKCNECGKILSNMANLELHANKTGHSDFEESTQSVRCLTAEEKAAKIAEIKALLKAKRAEREEAEKVDDVQREKQRRTMGKEMHKTREQLEMEQRKREAEQRKREKQEFAKERARIRAELAKDKAERQANKGKLSSKLAVEGYNPDGIQYDVDPNADDKNKSNNEQPQHHQQPKDKVDLSKLDDYISKVSSYKAGGDGGKCLKVLHAYVSNVLQYPNEPKYRSINLDNKAYKTKVKPFVGAKQILGLAGFVLNDAQDALVWQPPSADDQQEFLQTLPQKLEAALHAYG